jgi:hypothetical protein
MYKIQTLITWYFLKQFFGGENFYKSETRKKLDRVLIKVIAELLSESSEIFMVPIIFVGIVVIFCIADSFGLAL